MKLFSSCYGQVVCFCHFSLVSVSLNIMEKINLDDLILFLILNWIIITIKSK